MELVRIRRDPPLRFVDLDAGPRNVLTLEAVEALAAALSFDADTPVVVLSGRRDGFCAGLDNATLAAGAAPRERLLASMGALLVDALESGTRIVAVCEGHAVAAGAMLLLIADVRLGAPGAYKVGFTEPGLGMPLPELPALLARERLDRRRLHAATALGRVVGPEEALAFGFVDELLPGDALRAAAIERGRSLAALSEAAYRGSLAAAWGGVLPRLRELVARQRERADAVAAR